MHRGKCSNFSRQADRTGVSELEALKIGIFERGLTPELYERQCLGPYCRTVQESSYRPQRSAATLQQTVDNSEYSVVYVDHSVLTVFSTVCSNVAVDHSALTVLSTVCSNVAALRVVYCHVGADS